MNQKTITIADSNQSLRQEILRENFYRPVQRLDNTGLLPMNVKIVFYNNDAERQNIISKLVGELKSAVEIRAQIKKRRKQFNLLKTLARERYLKIVAVGGLTFSHLFIGFVTAYVVSFFVPTIVYVIINAFLVLVFVSNVAAKIFIGSINKKTS